MFRAMTLTGTWEVKKGESQFPVLPSLCREFKAALGNLGPACLKSKN